ncbi:MAG: hypothetical protein NC418_07150 [Muribaculaceae bacterium]|nr:hypothetical protein [Muribaculaceae bacterium]
MKKFFISAAIATMALSMNAQRTEGGDNLLANPSFEDPGYVQAIPEQYGWAPMNTCRLLSELPGWTLTGVDMWSFGAEVMDDPALDLGDGDMRPDDDAHWLRFYSDTDNAWTTIALRQKLTGLEVGKSYKLDFVVCGQPYAVVGSGDGSWNANLTVNVAIAEVDGDRLGREIKSQDLEEIEFDWTRRSIDFTPSASEIYVQVSMGSWLPSDSHDQAWLGLDCFDLYDPNGVNGIDEVVVDENAPVEYFNLQGMPVANPENGVFIRRQAGKVVKVAL